MTPCVAVHTHTFACDKSLRLSPPDSQSLCIRAAQSSQASRQLKQRTKTQTLPLAGFPEAQSSRNSPLIPEKLLSAGPDGGNTNLRITPPRHRTVHIHQANLLLSIFLSFKNYNHRV